MVAQALQLRRARGAENDELARAMRCSEVAGIMLGDLQDEPQGLYVNLPRSKTNQEGEEEFALIH